MASPIDEAKGHCSFCVQSPAVVAGFADRLTDFRCTKGSILFQPDRPIPAELVHDLVRARVAEVRGHR